MAAVKTMAGYGGKVVLSDLVGQGIEYNIRNWTIDWTGDVLDTTDFVSTGPRTFIGGLTSWTGTCEAMLDEGTNLLTLGFGNCPTDDDAAFEFSDAGNHMRFYGGIVVNSISPGVSVDGLPILTWGFQGTGALTQSDVA